MAVVVAGITGSSAWSVEKIADVRPGEAVELAGYRIALDEVRPRCAAPTTSPPTPICVC